MQERWPDCPGSLNAIVQRAIEKDPELRYASMDEILLICLICEGSGWIARANRLRKSCWR